MVMCRWVARLVTLSVISLLEDIRPSESIRGGFPRPLQGNKVCRYVSPEIGPIAFARLLWEPSSLPPPCKLTSFSVSLFLSLFSFLSFSPLVSSRLFSTLTLSFPVSLVSVIVLSRRGPWRSRLREQIFSVLSKVPVFYAFDVVSDGDTGFCDASRRYNDPL